MNEQIIYTLDLTKRHVIESANKLFVIAFTDEQKIYDNEEYLGMDAYECYILDEDNELLSRAVYYNSFTGDDYIRYEEQDIIIKIKIYPIEDETIKESIDKAHDGNE